MFFNTSIHVYTNIAKCIVLLHFLQDVKEESNPSFVVIAAVSVASSIVLLGKSE